jgi:DNA-binding response OmpR family regulator
MTFVQIVSREPRIHTTLSEYLQGRGFETAACWNYDEAMEQVPINRPDALIVDVQGVPRGDHSSGFSTFNHWLQGNVNGTQPAIIYLLHKGSRRPAFKVEGPVIKKPFPIEAIGEALRAQLGHPRRDGDAPQVQLDLTTNTLIGPEKTAHLTNIEATLLAYLMQHEGEIMHPTVLLVDVWQYRDAAGASTLVRAHVSNLRRKLREVMGASDYIQTVRGKGYRYTA